MNFLNHREGGAFLSGFPPFSFKVQCTLTHCRNCKRLREFVEIEISRQSCATVNNKEENS